MEQIVLEIINEIRAAKELAPIETVNAETKLREDLGLTSFDLAELTVKIEDKFDLRRTLYEHIIFLLKISWWFSRT